MDISKLAELLKNRDLHGSLEYLIKLKVDNGTHPEAIKSLYERCSNDGDRQFVSIVERQFTLIEHYSTFKVLFQKNLHNEVFLYGYSHKDPENSIKEFVEESRKAYELFFGPITEKLKISSNAAIIYVTIIESIIKKIKDIAPQIPSEGPIDSAVLEDFKNHVKYHLYLPKDQHKAMRLVFDVLNSETALDKKSLYQLEWDFFIPLRQEYAQKIVQDYHEKKYDHIETLLNEAAAQKLNIKDIFLQAIVKTDSLHEKNLFNVLHFFEYITDIGFEGHGLYPHEIMKIVLFAERKLRGASNEQPKFYAKEKDGKGLSCALIIDKANHVFYVLLENKEIEDANGSAEKRFTPTIIVDKVKKEAKLIGLTHKFRFSKNLDHDIERLARLSGKRGLAGLLFQTTFKKPSEVSERTLAHELFMHDFIPFSHFAKNASGAAKKSLSLNDLLDVIEDISCGIETMHAMDEVHADIKLENILYGEKDKHPYAALTDFGLTYHTKTERPLWVGFWYGTIFYTPPEFIEFPYAKHDGKAADMYALGCTLHELVAGPLPWYDDIFQLNESSDQMLGETFRKIPTSENKKLYLQTFNPLLKQAVVDKQKSIVKTLQDDEKRKKDFKPKEVLGYLIKKLLNPDPAKRLTAPQFRQAIAELKSKLA